MRSLKYLLRLLITTTVTAVPVAAQTALPFGSVTTGSIGAVAQSNRYTFSANANDVVNLTTVITSGKLIPKIAIYNPNGTELTSGYANYYGSCSGSTLEMNNVTLPTTGTYTVLFDDCSDTNTGAYQIFIQRTNNPTGAVALSFGGQPQSGTISTATQSNSYTFAAIAKDVVNLTMVATSGNLIPKVAVYNPNGTSLTSGYANYYGSCSGSTLELNNIAIPTTGAYTIIFDDCSDTNAGSYQIFMQWTNNPTGAGALSFGGQPQSGTISTATQSNSYTFAAIAKDVVNLTMVATSGNLIPKVAVYNPNGTSLTSGYANYYGSCSGSTLELNNIAIPTTGAYTIIFDDCSDTNAGSYQIFMQRTNNPAGAGALSFGGQPQTGSISTAAQTTSYTFSATTKDVVDLTMVATSGKLIPKVVVYNPNGTSLTSGYANYYGSCSGSTLELNNITIPSTGTYTVLVGDCSDTNSGNYNLSSQCFGTCSSTGSTAPVLQVTCVPAAAPTALGKAYTSACSATGGTAPYNWTVTGLPAGLTMSPSTGASTTISGTPTIAGTVSYTVTVTDSSAPPQSAKQSFSGTIAGPTLQISCVPATAPTALGTAYTSACTATGGTAPYNWTVIALPAGLTMSPSTGASTTISGTPTAAGTVSYTVTVTDSSSPPQSARQSFSGTIAGPTLQISCLPATAPTALGTAYTSACTATGGTAPYNWTVTGLPAGLAMSPSTGASTTISGTPTIAGTVSYTVTVTDSSAPPQSAKQSFSGTIAGPTLQISCVPATAPTALGTAYTSACAATGGTAPYNWTVTGLPAGLTMSPSTGASTTISGTPTAAGTVSYTVTVTDSSAPPQSTRQSFSGTIAGPTLQISCVPATAPTALGTAYTSACAATGGTAPYNWTVTGLPAGLTMSPSTGISTTISGTPTAAGTVSYAVTVTDSSAPPQSAKQSFSGTIAPSTASDGTVTVAPATATPGGPFQINLSLSMNGGKTPDAVTCAVQILPVGGALPLTTALTFTSSVGGSPFVSTGGADNTIAILWSSLNPPIAGTQLLGVVTGTIPSNATANSVYNVIVTGASASQGGSVLKITTGPSVTLTVAAAYSYLTGDSEPHTSDTAPGFGDNQNLITDLMSEILAINSVPGYVPAACSDRFDAMDAYPVDTSSNRGGDGVLDIRDLVVVLFRADNLDPARPKRVSGGGVCPVATPTAEPHEAMAEIVGGRLVLGEPESNGGGERVPLYLESDNGLENAALTLAVGDQRSRLRFDALAATPPTLMHDGETGVVALAWLGLDVKAGRFLLGYVVGPIGAGAGLEVYGVSATDSGHQRDLHIGRPPLRSGRGR